MSTRGCPLCQSSASDLYGKRLDEWRRCSTCRSVFRDIDPARFADLHEHAFEHDVFLADVDEIHGVQPNSRLWQQIGLPGGRVLELGPGSGHLLAAAKEDGREVWGVETSELHRKAIGDRWNIKTVVAAPDELPPALRFDVIVAINVVEHVYDIHALFRGLRERLTDTGLVFVSTVNARSLIASMVRTRWSMFKEPDHVSFPSPLGMRFAAQAAQLRPTKIWSTELPLETFISLAVSARDARRERAGGPGAPEESHGHELQQVTESHGHAGRRTVRAIYEYGRAVDPTSRLIGRMGRAGTVKALLARA